MPDGKKLINWSVANFLGLHNSAEIKVIQTVCLFTIYLLPPHTIYYLLGKMC